jgi:hypothetical protein
MKQFDSMQIISSALPPLPQSAAVNQESYADIRVSPQSAPPDSLRRREALDKAFFARYHQLEKVVEQQREIIAHHESTIASLERDLLDFCAHAHSCVQEAKEAAQQASRDAQVDREQALAVIAREQAAKEALAAASKSAINSTKVFLEQAAVAEFTAEKAIGSEVLEAATTRLSDTEAAAKEASKLATEKCARDLELNVKQLQKQLADQESSHQRQLQSICETYELRMEKLSEGVF